MIMGCEMQPVLLLPYNPSIITGTNVRRIVVFIPDNHIILLTTLQQSRYVAEAVSDAVTNAAPQPKSSQLVMAYTAAPS